MDAIGRQPARRGPSAGAASRRAVAPLPRTRSTPRQRSDRTICRGGRLGRWMGEVGSIWHRVARDVGLSEEHARRVECACRDDPALADELDFLVDNLSANLGGAFLRAFVGELERDAGREEALIGALQKTIRA